MYCPNCYLLVSGKKCPVCGSRNLREPVSEDYCFLVEKELIWAAALEDFLKDAPSATSCCTWKQGR